ncbi:MAG: ATP-binding protein [Bacteroidales bacterium]|nr:ATP-binding protein [Bacteroidales bacterium]
MSDVLQTNPFFTGIQIPDEYFCDRQKETEDLIALVKNGNNVVLKAKRRIGKSSLIFHVFNHRAIKNDFNTLYVDIFGTKSLADFHLTLQNKLLSAPFAKSAKIRRDFEAVLRSLSFSFGEYNPVTGAISLPTIGTSPSQLPLLPMEDLFGFLENTAKPNLVVFDEFQQIQYYPERMAAILRSFTQKMNNTKFIFSGSSSHLLTVTFQMANQPFYKSAESYQLGELPEETYYQFCRRLFKAHGKEISEDAVQFLYELFSGETAPMQETMNRTFSIVGRGQKADIQIIKEAVNQLLTARDASFREILNRIERENVRNTLYCIAALGIADNLTSAPVIKRYKLNSASSVQKSLLSLQDENSPLIRKIAKGVYVLEDRLFELWIAREGNYLDYKYAAVHDRFVRQHALENPSFHPTAPLID